MLQAEEYNALPSVHDAHNALANLDHVHEQLCTIIEEFGLGDVFGVRLIHKHFPMYEGEVPTFRPINVPGVCTAILMGPIRAKDTQAALYGKNYLVKSAGGPLVPYEFTTAPCKDPNFYPEFLMKFTEALLSSNAEKVLGLCTDPKTNSDNYTEFELSEKR